MKGVSTKVVWLVLGFALAVALLVASVPGDGPRTNAERIDDLASEIRCPTCAGLSVAESSSPLAQSSEAEITRLVEEGRTDGQIRTYFEDRYGPTALMTPARSGISLFVWVAPVAFAVLAVVGVALTVRKWKRNPELEYTPDDASDTAAPTFEAEKAPARPVSRKAFTSQRLIYAGIAAFIVVAGVAAFSALDQREAGDTLTGGIEQDADTPTLLAQAQSLTAEGKAADALAAYDAVLAREPDNVQALTYRGWLVRLGGFPDLGLQSLDRAVAIDPNYSDARFFRGFIKLRDQNKPQEALVDLEASVAGGPPQGMGPLIDSVLADARAQAAPA